MIVLKYIIFALISVNLVYASALSGLKASGISVDKISIQQEATTGLEFTGNTGTTCRFRITDIVTKGLPIWGPGGNGATYIWKAMPYQQAGYYTTFFWGNDDDQCAYSTWAWDQGSADSYFGAHPFPLPNEASNNQHWEISVFGQDVTESTEITYNQWYTQALRVWNDNGDKHLEYYWNLPSTTDKITYVVDAQYNYGEQNPPYPMLTFGDAPWNCGYEVYDGVLRGFQVYAALLSLADIADEIDSPLSTVAGAASIFYLKINPTPTDIADDSGNGHDPDWVGARRPNLWTP